MKVIQYYLKLPKSIKQISFLRGFHSNTFRLCNKNFPEDFSNAYFNAIVGTDHSYIKMNWNQCFTHKKQSDTTITPTTIESDQNISKPNKEKVQSVTVNDVNVPAVDEKLSEFKDEHDESDDIEEIKDVIENEEIVHETK